MNKPRTKWFVVANREMSYQGSEQIRLHFFAGEEVDIDVQIARMEEYREDQDIIDNYRLKREEIVKATGGTKYVNQSLHRSDFTLLTQRNNDDPNRFYACWVVHANLTREVVKALSKLERCEDGVKAIEILKARHVTHSGPEFVLCDVPEIIRKK